MRTAKDGSPVDIALGIEYHVPQRTISVVAAGEVVQIGFGSASAGRYQLEDRATVVGSAVTRSAVQISRWVSHQTVPRFAASRKTVKDALGSTSAGMH